MWREAICDYIYNRAKRVIFSRAPDFIIGDPKQPSVKRWFWLPRNKWLNIYIHHFLRSDDDRAHHDHPWLFNFSYICRGEYIEHVIRAGGVHEKVTRRPGDAALRFLGSPHRIALGEQTCVTIFITGPVVRGWGFHCPDGWVHYMLFTTPTPNGNKTGRGCGDA